MEAQRHRWTVRDVEQMVIAGVLSSDDRVELIDGEVVDKGGHRGPHVACTHRLNMMLVLGGGGRWVVSVQNPVVLDDHSAPEPDVTVLVPRPDRSTALPTVPEVVVIIEVASTSASSDRPHKVSAYARAGSPRCGWSTSTRACWCATASPWPRAPAATPSSTG